MKCISWAPVLVDLGGGRQAAALASCSDDRGLRVWRSPKVVEGQWERRGPGVFWAMGLLSGVWGCLCVMG